jgi:hypothetical protein
MLSPSSRTGDSEIDSGRLDGEAGERSASMVNGADGKLARAGASTRA